MKRFFFTTFSFLLLALTLSAQTPTPTPVEDDNGVVKITTSLVQLDAVVTDKKGNPVTNLTADDFEILQDGKQQKITNFSYISRTINAGTTEQTANTPQNKQNGIPPVSFRPKETGRVLTFIVDDGNECIDALGILAVKEGLEKFVNQQMLPGDLVAIYQTRQGSSLLQQYTADKANLLRIVRKIRWYPPQRIGGCRNSAGEVNIDEKEQNRNQREGNDTSVNRNVFSGAVGVGMYAINGLRQIGGRKIMFILSDTIPLLTGDRQQTRRTDGFSAIRELADLANRNSVVINTIDVRGVTNPAMIDAARDVEGLARSGGESVTNNIAANQARDDSQRRGGMAFLANETGGRFYDNANFLDVPIARILNSERGYYLLAYEPEDESFKGKNFHQIKVNLKRADLTVSSRSGFFGVTDEERRPKPRTEDSQLYNALTAPVPNADLNLRLSAYFVNNPNKGNFIHALLYIDGKDITFQDEPGNTKKVVFDLVAVTLSEKNEVIDDTNRTATVHIPLDRIEDVRRDGLVYSVDVPVKKDGIYTFRTALRDKIANRLGSSSQVIEVPNLSKNKLLISGLIISGVDAKGNLLPTESGESAFSSVVSQSIAAIRRFRRNSIVGYSYTLYNAGPDKSTRLPNLTVQTNLYYDGKMFSEGQPQPVEIGKQADLSRLIDFGYLKLNSEVPLGDYVLQVIVRDLTTGQITSQRIDFEVVE